MGGRWFAHSGDLGDIIYALPAIREAGGGWLYLFDSPGKTWHGMTRDRAECVIPLLAMQRYLDGVTFCPEGHADSSLNGFRDHWRAGRNLADMHLATQGFGPEGRLRRWLEVDRVVADHLVVFARSERCRSDAFPWKQVFEEYREVAVFVGTVSEHGRFCEEVGCVPHVETADLLELARLLAGARLFVGNQSAPAAIAEGLKAAVILEVCPEMDNCRFERLGRVHVTSGPLELPRLQALTTAPLEDRTRLSGSGVERS